MKRGLNPRSNGTGELSHALERLRSIGIRIDEAGFGARGEAISRANAFTGHSCGPIPHT